MPTYARYNTLPTYSLLPRETQDFASLHAAAAIVINSNISYYTQSNQSRDAKSCVSRPVPCRHAHAIIRWQHTHFSIVRRKILRLYMLPPPLSSTANISYYTQSNQSRDAKSCVSRPVPYRHMHAVIRWHQMHPSLVRRKILRLYKAGALIMHAYIPHIRRAFLSACRDMAVKIHASS